MGIPARRSRWWALGAMVFLGLSARPSHATSMVQLTTSQLVDASESIVRGTVVEVWSELDDQGAIWTRAQVDVSEVLKGDADTEAVVVDQRGGTYGGLTVDTGGAARFSVGEDVLLFLETLHGDHVVPVGMVQGKYTIQMDPYVRKLTVRRFAVPFRAPYDARFLPALPAAQRLTLDDLETQVRDRVSAGWDGQPIPGASLDHLRQINRVRGAE